MFHSHFPLHTVTRLNPKAVPFMVEGFHRLLIPFLTEAKVPVTDRNFFFQLVTWLSWGVKFSRASLSPSHASNCSINVATSLLGVTGGMLRLDEPLTLGGWILKFGTGMK